MISSAKDKGRLEGKIEAAKSVLDILDDETIASRFDLDINLVRGLRK
ncbi:hypothetical protein [uncultured Clostridium sp.]|jgi:hypothetical protein|nr:hypothetical protein [uncultured Clostridium sp.]